MSETKEQLPKQVSGQGVDKQQTWEELLDEIEKIVINTNCLNCWKIWVLLCQYPAAQSFHPTECEKVVVKIMNKSGVFGVQQLAHIYRRSSETIHNIIHDERVKIPEEVEAFIKERLNK